MKKIATQIFILFVVQSRLALAGTEIPCPRGIFGRLNLHCEVSFGEGRIVRGVRAVRAELLDLPDACLEAVLQNIPFARDLVSGRVRQIHVSDLIVESDRMVGFRIDRSRRVLQRGKRVTFQNGNGYRNSVSCAGNAWLDAAPPYLDEL